MPIRIGEVEALYRYPVKSMCGEPLEAATICITNRDERCSMVNFDPESARPTAEVLKVIVRERDNKAGVYGTVTRRGRLTVGQPICFEPATA